MKIAIITITDGLNYGNRLQNYALQEVLRGMGHQVETIKRRTIRDYRGFVRLFQIFKEGIKRIIGRNDTSFLFRKREKCFEEFIRSIRYSKFETYNNLFPKALPDHYDFFLCGSDQIWNSRFKIVQDDLSNYLAYFADGSKRIAYAASFGTENVPSCFEQLFSEELMKFKRIGVREYKGAEIIERLCGRRDVKLVLDPTLLLGVEKWRKIEKKPTYVDDKFILTYFLGEKNSKVTDHIKKNKELLKTDVIELSTEFKLDKDINNQEWYCTNPNEFLWLIDNAECVFTDSYHASVFSILFHRPFISYTRISSEQNNKTESRLETLLGMVGLTEFLDDIKNPQKYPATYDGECVDKLLSLKQKESIEFLLEAIDS